MLHEEENHMAALALMLLLGQTPVPQEDTALRAEVVQLRSELALMQTALKQRDALLGTVRDELTGARGDLLELKQRPQPLAAPFLAAPPVGSDRLGVARTAVFAPRVDVESFLRHDSVYLKLRRVEAQAVRTVAEVEITPDAPGVDLPLDMSGALYLVEWSTSEGHTYDLVLRDGASGQPAASVPVKERQSEGRFAFVGYRVD
jgi:hypothetical protein